MSYIKTTFTALGVEVLKLSHIPDTTGIIVPPECYVTLPQTPMKVTFGTEDMEHKAGTATLRRVGDNIVADMVLFSTMKDSSKALKMISKLYPAVGYDVTEAEGNIVFKLKITELFLTTYLNEDLKIKPLGSSIQLKRKAGDMH